MSRLFDDYAAGPSYSDNASASWHSHQSTPYDYPDFYSSGACAAATGESPATGSEFSDSAFSPSYDYADSPFSFDELESTTPLSPSSSASSSSSSCSDAPITPYYQLHGGIPLPKVEMLFTGLDATVCRQYCDSTLEESAYGYESWDEEDEDVTMRYSGGVEMSESSMRSSAMYTKYDSSDALWACESAITQLQYSDASPRSGFAPDPPTYASSDFRTVTSSAVPLPHAHEYPFSYPPVSCLSSAALAAPPPLKLHQPQPRRSIPVVSLSALASESENIPSHFERTTSQTVSPRELRLPSSQAQGVAMTSYSENKRENYREIREGCAEWRYHAIVKDKKWGGILPSWKRLERSKCGCSGRSDEKPLRSCGPHENDRRA
ncbi:hypothetical protein B0H17DRAFT_1136316 [Mycena rosella]|uniref:Uncharacterized protein n=1 Tax=Mycena rosella TaxID=1033263 RepID=A0AAD7DB16_MYCRO|nr:hypothetical protein B0H17DRAFT_1136316 [Mycena rosella]